MVLKWLTGRLVSGLAGWLTEWLDIKRDDAPAGSRDEGNLHWKWGSEIEEKATSSTLPLLLLPHQPSSQSVSQSFNTPGHKHNQQPDSICLLRILYRRSSSSFRFRFHQKNPHLIYLPICETRVGRTGGISVFHLNICLAGRREGDGSGRINTVYIEKSQWVLLYQRIMYHRRMMMVLVMMTIFLENLRKEHSSSIHHRPWLTFGWRFLPVKSHMLRIEIKEDDSSPPICIFIQPHSISRY